MEIKAAKTPKQLTEILKELLSVKQETLNRMTGKDTDAIVSEVVGDYTDNIINAAVTAYREKLIDNFCQMAGDVLMPVIRGYLEKLLPASGSLAIKPNSFTEAMDKGFFGSVCAANIVP